MIGQDSRIRRISSAEGCDAAAEQDSLVLPQIWTSSDALMEIVVAELCFRNNKCSSNYQVNQIKGWDERGFGLELLSSI